MDRIKILMEDLKNGGISTHAQNETIYKYVTVATAIEILKNNTLLYQTPKEFNDPLDPHYSLLDLMQQAKKEINSQIDLPKEMKEQFLREAEIIFYELTEKQVNNLGVLCLSKSFTETLMWSHYSQKHKGVCLGFKNLGCSEGLNVNTFVVKYEKEVIPIKYDFEAKQRSPFPLVNMLCTKALVWHYEKEVRIIRYIGSGYIPFEKSSLCEIYFGVNSESPDINSIINGVTDCGYKIDKIGKMQTVKTKFELEPKFHTTEELKKIV
jgi:hypothetical protein